MAIVNKFYIVFKHGDGTPVQSARIGNEKVCEGLYNVACDTLYNSIKEGMFHVGYVRMYYKSKLVKELHVEQNVAFATTEQN